MTTTGPIESHAIHSRRMLDHAAEMIAQGDRLQASEKIWGAAAHRLKEIATEREWPNDSHADGFAIIQYIGRHFGDRRIGQLFGLASDTHQNFYEDRLPVDELSDRLESIASLLDLLDEAHRTLPSDLPMPSERHYRSRHP
jgi:hypothetical protein